MSYLPSHSEQFHTMIMKCPIDSTEIPVVDKLLFILIFFKAEMACTCKCVTVCKCNVCVNMVLSLQSNLPGKNIFMYTYS